MLDTSARHGFAGEMLDLLEPQTEADSAAILFQFFAAFGNCVGRNGWFPVEATRHHSNLFVCVVGKSSKARKGTSWSQVQRMMTLGAPEWLPRLQKGLSSGEGLLAAVRDANADEGDAGVTDKRLMIIEPEFASVLQRMARDGNTLSANLREGFDGGTMQVMTRTKPLIATNAHLSLVTHITKTELQRLLNATERSNGLANRFLWIYAERSKLLPEGGDVDPAALEAMGHRLGKIIESASNEHRYSRTVGARALWRDVYTELNAEPVGTYGEMTSRAQAQVTRLSMIYAMLDRADDIDTPHLEAALAAWHYAKESALLVFGDDLANPLANRIRALLEERPHSRTDISKAFTNNLDKKRLDEALAALVEAGLAHCTTSNTNGRPVETWHSGRTKETN